MNFTKKDVFLYYANLLDTQRAQELEALSLTEPRIRKWLDELDPDMHRDPSIVMAEAVEHAVTADLSQYSREFTQMYLDMEQEDRHERIRKLISQWKSAPGWLMEHIKSAVDLLAESTRGILDKATDFPAVVFQGDAKGADAVDEDDSIPTTDEFEHISRDGIYRLRTKKEKVPYGFGLIYVVDRSQDNRLVAMQPVMLDESPNSYWLKLDLRQLVIQTVHSQLTARIVAASEDTTMHYTETMLQELKDCCAHGAQVERIDKFIDIWKEKEKADCEV